MRDILNGAMLQEEMSFKGFFLSRALVAVLFG